jgi:hypothetical protein
VTVYVSFPRKRPSPLLPDALLDEQRRLLADDNEVAIAARSVSHFERAAKKFLPGEQAVLDQEGWYGVLFQHRD